ncbi:MULTISPECIES: hypothetical protein [Halomonas]|uniref:hypothetical protein n=1 Tax=Halomonas TaxID=2745 RepID=UPI001C95E531|nr:MULTISPECIES: hypothetical protein [Halomonas]MBY6209073.1 hypothetical protein [Halomonas sp. DP3Y7-2]MBY6229229.1 hypothetical protein [Halomonas sp. DP3Y7-1]MCA0917708.1 hypothetical protein [Halomonas denitrificans]
MKKVIAMAGKADGQFPRSAYVQNDPKVGDTLPFFGEPMIIREVISTPHIAEYDFIVSLSRRHES